MSVRGDHPPLTAIGTRERLLAAARELIDEGGYGATSVLAIAERAGVAAGTLYRHFASKQDLFVELFRDVCVREDRAIAAAIEELAPTVTATERIELVIATFAERALGNRRLAWALLAEPVDPRVDAERLAYRARSTERIAVVLARGIAIGELPEQNVSLTAAALVGACGEALVGPLSPLGDGRPGSDEVVAALRAFVRRAVGGAMNAAVRVTRDGPVTTVQLNRSRRRNAVDGATATALADAFRSFDADPDASVAVLHGAGGVFCAGADLQSVGTPDGNHVSDDGDGPMGPTRLRLSKPVIAAIDGYAVAGGLELALWCDLRVAGADAVLGVFCRRWGVPLIDGGTVRLPRLIGSARAMDLVLTGRPVDAEEALGIGLVNRVVDAGRSLEAAQELAATLAALPQACLREDRLSLLEQESLDQRAALANELRHGRVSLAQAAPGLERFRTGAGRHGAPVQ